MNPWHSLSSPKTHCPSATQLFPHTCLWLGRLPVHCCTFQPCPKGIGSSQEPLQGERWACTQSPAPLPHRDALRERRRRSVGSTSFLNSLPSWKRPGSLAERPSPVYPSCNCVPGRGEGPSMRVCKMLEMSRKRPQQAEGMVTLSWKSVFCYQTLSPANTDSVAYYQQGLVGLLLFPSPACRRSYCHWTFQRSMKLSIKVLRSKHWRRGDLGILSPTDQRRIERPDPSALPDRSHKSCLFCPAYWHSDKFILHSVSNLSGNFTKSHQVHTKGEANNPGMQVIVYLWT